MTVDGSGSGLDADRLDGIDASGFVLTTQFGDLFDSALGGLFGTDDSTESNDRSDLGSHFLAEVYLTAADFHPTAPRSRPAKRSRSARTLRCSR